METPGGRRWGRGCFQNLHGPSGQAQGAHAGKQKNGPDWFSPWVPGGLASPSLAWALLWPKLFNPTN